MQRLMKILQGGKDLVKAPLEEEEEEKCGCFGIRCSNSKNRNIMQRLQELVSGEGIQEQGGLEERGLARPDDE